MSGLITEHQLQALGDLARTLFDFHNISIRYPEALAGLIYKITEHYRYSGILCNVKYYFCPHDRHNSPTKKQKGRPDQAALNK
jgi:hypothetical protein